MWKSQNYLSYYQNQQDFKQWVADGNHDNVSTKKPLVVFYTIKAMQLLITATLGNVTCSSVPQEVDNCNLKASWEACQIGWWKYTLSEDINSEMDWWKWCLWNIYLRVAIT